MNARLQARLAQTAAATAVLPSAAAPSVRRYIRSEAFDIVLLYAPLATGLMVGRLVVGEPRLFAVALLADLWLLSYQHVVATYTRLALDRPTFRRNRFLAVELLALVMAGTLIVTFSVGAWFIATAYLYLQWFHYLRQSYGVSRMYFRATTRGAAPDARDTFGNLAIYLVPIYLIAWRSAHMGDQFLFMPVKPIVLPEPVIMALGAAAAAGTAAWLIRTVSAAVRGQFDPMYFAYILSHLTIFWIGYRLIEDVNTGWLAVNIWHNFQYVLVVWMSNAKRFSRGIDAEAPLLSRISQPGRVVTYFACCLALSTVIYLGLDRFVWLVGGGLAATVGIYMGINFHHYIVDAVIWKRRPVTPQAA